MVVRVPLTSGMRVNHEAADLYRHGNSTTLRELFVAKEHKQRRSTVLVEAIALLLAGAVFGVPATIALVREGVVAVAVLLLLVGLGCWTLAILRPVMLPREHRRKREQFRALLYADPYCVVCGYALAGLAIEPDGCVICPECGAAWRVYAPDV